MVLRKLNILFLP